MTEEVFMKVRSCRDGPIVDYACKKEAGFSSPL
jgi:hypothetical protein